ncbi:MAG: hypothetical protein ACPGTO_06865, partial [Polaribacter sp.]
KLPEDVRKLKGFIWREVEQPKKMEDIFIKGKISKPKKGIQKKIFTRPLKGDVKGKAKKRSMKDRTRPKVAKLSEKKK